MNVRVRRERHRAESVCVDSCHPAQLPAETPKKARHAVPIVGGRSKWLWQSGGKQDKTGVFNSLPKRRQEDSPAFVEGDKYQSLSMIGHPLDLNVECCVHGYSITFGDHIFGQSCGSVNSSRGICVN